MATSLPWSVKGVDPRTRDAAKAAARRAGMTLGEWLDHKILVEAGQASAPAEPTPNREEPEQLDIAALSERLAKLSQGRMDTAAPAAAATLTKTTDPLPGVDIDAVVSQAASAERLTRESSAKTAGALDSIARWIEKTENRIADGERSLVERQDKTATVVADAIKTMGERLIDIERKTQAAPRQAQDPQSTASKPVAAPPPRTPPAAPLQTPPAARAVVDRAVMDRESLAAAVTDIRTRQKVLDNATSGPARPAAQAPTSSMSRIASLRDDLRLLSAKSATPMQRQPVAASAMTAPAASTARTATAYAIQPMPMPEPTLVEPVASPIETMIADLGAKLDKIDRRDHLEPVLKPLARLESEVAKLARQPAPEPNPRVALDIAHLVAKVDALAARGADQTILAPVLADIAGLRETLAKTNPAERVDGLSEQVASLAAEIGRLRESQPDGRELQSLSLAIQDVRDTIVTDRSREPMAEPGGLVSLSLQVEALASKIDALPTVQPEVLSAQADQLHSRLSEMDASGQQASAELSRHIEALVASLEKLADHQPRQIETRIDALQSRIETLVTDQPTAIERQIEALAERIDLLATSTTLRQGASDSTIVQVDMRPVEEMLRGLAEKIDEAGRPGAGTESFDALEQQIAGLASRLDAAAATRDSTTGIEQTLQDLVIHLQGMREDSTAERAARAAVADFAGQVQLPDGALAELSGLVSDLHQTNISTGRDTQDALGAVHQTLETIISRLASLEADIQATQRTPMPPRVTMAAAPVSPPQASSAVRAALPPVRRPATAAHEPAPAVPAEAPMPETVASSLDMPLEPGSGRPRSDGSAPSIQDPQAVRQDLIAAARRSAKAATEAAAAAPGAKTETAKTGGRLQEIMEKRRRPVLLGLAALVLAMGAAHVLSGPAADKTTASASNEAVVMSAPTGKIEPKSETGATQDAAKASVKDAAPVIEPSSGQVQGALLPQVQLGPNPAQAASSSPATAADTTAAPAITIASLPPTIEPTRTVTAIGDLPAGLGSAGLRKAAQDGDARAVYELATKAVDGPVAARDPKLALRLFERAGVAGLAPAQFRLGNMFEKGVGTPRDPSLARVWYTRAAEAGNAKAMHNLAVLHAEGLSGKPDYTTASEWFTRAAEVGVRDSQYNLAILLGRGLGAPVDLVQSYVWFAIAAGQGDEDAARKRDEVAGRLTPADLAAAKSKVATWRPKTLDSAANEVAPPAKGWDDAPGTASRKPADKPAKATRG